MIDKRLVKAIHRRLIAVFGGIDGVRDEGLLESALARPENLQCYNPQCDVFDKAGTLVFGLIKNHAFVDGNKRVAAVVCELVLAKEGFCLLPSELEKYNCYMLLASGDMSEAHFISWLRQSSQRAVN